MSPARVVLIIIDACGVGEMPDSALYGDAGAATLPHVADAVGGLTVPVLTGLGLGNIEPISGVPAQPAPKASFGKMAEKSAGKDSTVGHWEIGGLISERPLPVFPAGFPEPIVRRFERQAGVKTIGNIPASGTEIIAQLGEQHLRTREVILYTSADSVFQLAAHQDIYPLDQLYEMCRVARELLTGEYAVARVIARPFAGRPGQFERTTGRKDFSLAPPADTIIDLMSAAGCRTLAVGKVYDLFAGRGFDTHRGALDNASVMETVIDAVRADTQHNLIFANCVDFDMLWGHRNDEAGFARGLEEFDLYLGRLLDRLHPNDLLLITADHGCDPTIKSSTDHTREYVPLLAAGADVRPGVDLGTRRTFADIACSVAELFNLEHNFEGKSFLTAIRKDG